MTNPFDDEGSEGARLLRLFVKQINDENLGASDACEIGIQIVISSIAAGLDILSEQFDENLRAEFGVFVDKLKNEKLREFRKCTK